LFDDHAPDFAVALEYTNLCWAQIKGVPWTKQGAGMQIDSADLLGVASINCLDQLSAG